MGPSRVWKVFDWNHLQIIMISFIYLILDLTTLTKRVSECIVFKIYERDSKQRFPPYDILQRDET